MKRSVAVQGATPRFVRWAVWCPCPFRDQVERRFADLAFRNLRGIRAYSQAAVDGRVIDGVCLHPTTAGDQESVPVRGFPMEEVLDPFGGLGTVSTACGQCPGNVATIEGQPGLAGCYGFLTNDGLDLEQLLAGYSATGKEGFDLAQLLDRVAKTLPSRQAPQQEIWYWLWRSGTLQGEPLDWAVGLFDAVIQRTQVPDIVVRFAEVLHLAADRKLAIKGQCIPSGYSDGQVWELAQCCPNCGYQPESPESFTRCPVCRMQGELPPGQRSKVLGTRPYVDLERVLGRSAAQELATKYRRQLRT